MILNVHLRIHFIKFIKLNNLCFFQDGEARVRVEIHPVDALDKRFNIDESASNLVDQGVNLAKLSPVQSFLSGKNCLTGVR